MCVPTEAAPRGLPPGFPPRASEDKDAECVGAAGGGGAAPPGVLTCRQPAPGRPALHGAEVGSRAPQLLEHGVQGAPRLLRARRRGALQARQPAARVAARLQQLVQRPGQPGLRGGRRRARSPQAARQAAQLRPQPLQLAPEDVVGGLQQHALSHLRVLQHDEELVPLGVLPTAVTWRGWSKGHARYRSAQAFLGCALYKGDLPRRSQVPARPSTPFPLSTARKNSV